MNFYRQSDVEFPDIWRVFLSGSSASGKTTFAETLETKDDIEEAIDEKAKPTKPVKEVATSVKVGMPKTASGKPQK